MEIVIKDVINFIILITKINIIAQLILFAQMNILNCQKIKTNVLIII